MTCSIFSLLKGLLNTVEETKSTNIYPQGGDSVGEYTEDTVFNKNIVKVIHRQFL